jgi:hypothetical protein
MKQHPAVDPSVPVASDRKRAHVVNLDAYRAHLRVTRSDPPVDAIWDELTSLAQEAWVWRDPDSVEAVERLIATLKTHVLSDWRE